MSRAIRMLQDRGSISRAQLEQATLLQGRYGQTLSFHLITAGALDENDFADFVERHFPGRRWPRRKLKSIPRHVISVIPARLAANVRILPVELEDDRLLLGITDSSRSYVLEEASYQTRCHVSPVILTESEMTWALEHYHGIATRTGPPHPLVQDVQTDEHAFTPARTTPPSVVVHKPIVLGRVEDTAVRRPPRARPEPKTSWRPETLADSIRSSSRTPAPKPDPHPRGCVALASLVADMILDRDSRAPSDIPKDENSFSSIPASSTEDAADSLIERGRRRDGIIDMALDQLLHFSARAAFFVVKEDRIRGYSIKGALTHTEAVRSFWIPTTTCSTLGDAVLQGRIYLGRLGTSPADSILAASLGGRPSRVLIIPVKIGHRVVCLLYCDGLTIDVPPGHTLKQLAETVGSSLAELITKN